LKKFQILNNNILDFNCGGKMPATSQYIPKKKFKPDMKSFNPWQLSETNIRERTLSSNLQALYSGLPEHTSIRKSLLEADLKLIEANTKMSLLWAATLHDIRNQLTGLQGYLSLLEHAPAGATADSYLAKAREAANVIATDIDSASTCGYSGLWEPEWQDPTEVIGRIHRSIIPVKVVLEHVEIFADPMLWQVFSNLIDNAVQHGEHVREVHIFGAESPDFYTIIVSDDGIGIPYEEKEMIFQRGYGKNTGLGLHLVRDILAITGIRIRESGKPGKGARFEITIPEGRYRFPSLFF
jgi:signal transduction histidine kinase